VPNKINNNNNGVNRTEKNTGFFFFPESLTSSSSSLAFNHSIATYISYFGIGVALITGLGGGVTVSFGILFFQW
jgi:hypothetical protein